MVAWHPAESVLEMERVGKRFGQVWVLKDVNLEVRRGSIHAIVGHNGAGKSTLMKIALGAVTPTAGEVRVAGQKLTFSRPAEARTLGLGMVMQERSLIRTLNGLNNLYLNAEYKGAMGLIDVRRQRVEIATLLEELAIPRELLSTIASDMSTIEQELIEIARALRLGSQVLILDEPTAPLGREEITRLFGVLRTIAARGAGIVIITHHLAEVFAVSDMVTCLREGEVVLQTATKETNMSALISAMLGRRPWEGSHLPRTAAKRVDGAQQTPRLRNRSRRSRFENSRWEPSSRMCRSRLFEARCLASSDWREAAARRCCGRCSETSVKTAAKFISVTSATGRIRRRTRWTMASFSFPEDRGVHGLMLSKSITENIALVILRRLSGFMGLSALLGSERAGQENDEGSRRPRHRSRSDGERALGRQSAESGAGEGSDA